MFHVHDEVEQTKELGFCPNKCCLFQLLHLFIESCCIIHMNCNWRMRWALHIRGLPNIHAFKKLCCLGCVCPYPIAKFMKLPNFWHTNPYCTSFIFLFAITFFEWIYFKFHLLWCVHKHHPTFRDPSIDVLYDILPHPSNELREVPIGYIHLFVFF